MPIRFIRHFAAMLALLPMLSACLTPADPMRVEPIAFDPAAALKSVNAFRAENHLPALAIDGRLTAAAAAQSEAMAARGTLDHDVAGALPRRLTAQGYDWGAAAENIGRGYADYGAAMRGWIGSPKHRRNLLNPNVRAVGFAGARDLRDGRPYWTQIFGAEREPAAVATGRPLGGVTTARGATLRFP